MAFSELPEQTCMHDLGKEFYAPLFQSVVLPCHTRLEFQCFLFISFTRGKGQIK